MELKLKVLASKDQQPRFLCKNTFPPYKSTVTNLGIKKSYTPLKFNMEPEKKSLEKEIPFGNHHVQVPS